MVPISYETGYCKYITDSEFKSLLDTVNRRRSPPFGLCFKFMAYMGLRVSEAVSLKTDNLNKGCSQLTYKDLKTKVVHIKMLPPFFSKEIANYIKSFSQFFIDGYLFPPLHNKVSHNPHLQTSTFRMFFKEFRETNGLNQPYYTCKDGKKLYRISPHTLKHYCLFKVYKASGNDLSFTKIFSGHKEMEHTLRYIQHEDSRLNQAEILEKAFT